MGHSSLVIGTVNISTIVKMQLRPLALNVLLIRDPAEKVMAMRSLWAQRSGLTLDRDRCPLLADIVAGETPALPGRPDRPRLIPAKQVPTRSPFTHEGLATLLHAVCHIEFNAINLALDAVWRFNGMPDAFYEDWLRVAFEESKHFDMLHQHLQSMGYAYGDFDAHDGLWQMCERTAQDVLARMALVPRTLEARGLDATPLIQEKLRKAATPDALRVVALLDIILRDEVGHVAIGNHWYRYLCDQRGLDPVPLYGELVKQYDAPKLRPPFNTSARKKAGFTDTELDYLLG
jgi:uncharacterized ferritin-like protein (DUF455 family)